MFMFNTIIRKLASFFNRPSSPDFRIPEDKTELRKNADKYINLVAAFKDAYASTPDKTAKLGSQQLISLVWSTLGTKFNEIKRQRGIIEKLEGGCKFLEHADIFYPLGESSLSSLIPKKTTESFHSEVKPVNKSKPSRSCFLFSKVSFWRRSEDPFIPEEPQLNVLSKRLK